MGVPPAPSETSSAGISSRALERGLDELAQHVRADVEPLAFLTATLRLLVHTARAEDADVWLRSGEQSWTRVGLSVSSPDGGVTSDTNVSPPEWLAAALLQTGPETTRFPYGGQPATRLAGPIRQGGQPTGVLDAVWEGSVSASALLPFVGAIGELIGDFLVQHELRMLRRERLESKQWELFQAALADAQTLAHVATVIANDGRSLTGSDRVAVIQWHAGRARGLAVSGADVLDARSTTLQVLERLAMVAATLRQPLWHVTEETTSHDAITTWRQITHGIACGVLPLMRVDGIDGVLVCERLSETPDIATWQKRCETLVRFAAPSWSALIEQQRGLIGRWNRRRQRIAARTGKVAAMVAILAGVVTALAVIPADHVITGEGQLLPAVRRDVFASTSGLVRELRVQHGDEVTAGQTLVVLRDPQAELEAARVVGELATVRTRLSVVQSARIAAIASGADAPLRAQQLTAEEEELKQRLESLTRQQALLDEQRATWDLQSPIAGQVLTWDLESRLTGRPVERGQVLLTVGDVAGDWIVEARIPERDIGALWAVSQTSNVRLPVEFITTLDTHAVRKGHVREIARTAEIDDQGESTLRVTIAFDRNQPGPLRPGATVLPRIHCGRRSLGYIWLYPAADAIRRMWWRSW
jgi:multidrug efflux pump subunit AcrA (membrane-fusion protein)